MSVERGTGSIDGFRCKKCGNFTRFKICASSRFHVLADGTDSYEDVEWDDSSDCECSECGESGVVADFCGRPRPVKVSVSFVPEDVVGLGKRRARLFLEENAKCLADRLSEFGNEVLADLVQMSGLKKKTNKQIKPKGKKQS